MLSFQEQVRRGFLVCPNTLSRLYFEIDKKCLVSTKDNTSYPVLNGIPILLKNEVQIKALLTNSQMVDKYERESVRRTRGGKFTRFKKKLELFLMDDFRSLKSNLALKDFDNYCDDDLCIAIGGGPSRRHNNLLNLNIGPFDNVDIVADAHYLPYAANCVDAIFCEAVIEHLYNPLLAIKEMYRVLKQNGIVLSITSFLQPYHGFPDHYQNLTLTGHETYFAMNGFEVIESGTCGGPTYSLIILTYQYLRNYLPKFIGKLVYYPYLISAMLLLKTIDKRLNIKRNSHELASSTYVIGKKL